MQLAKNLARTYWLKFHGGGETQQGLVPTAANCAARGARGGSAVAGSLCPQGLPGCAQRPGGDAVLQGFLLQTATGKCVIKQ